MMHSPCFRFPPLFSRNFQTLKKIFKIVPFPEKFLDFHPPKFLTTFFLVINRKFRISPLFPLFQYISPYFAKIIISPPTLTNFPPCFRQFHIFYVYFVSPPTLTMMHLCITQCTYWTPLGY